MKHLLFIAVLVLSSTAWAQGPTLPVTPTAPIQQPFTIDEYNAMLQLLDLGVKSGGLSVAEAGVVLMKKIKANMEVIQERQAK